MFFEKNWSFIATLLLDRLLSNLTKAIFIIFLAILSFDLMSLIIKFFSNQYHILQIAVFRNIFGFIPPLILVIFTKKLTGIFSYIGKRESMICLLRAISICCAQVCFYTALASIDFAIAITLAFVGPFFVTALSVPVLGLSVGIWRWTAILIGFFGVAVIMRPGVDSFSVFYLFPIGAALGYAVSTVLVRLFHQDLSSGIIQLHTQFYILIISVFIMFIFVEPIPLKSILDIGLFLAIGIFGGTGVLCLISCYRLTEPSQIAPFEYFSIPISFFLGWYFFAEAPFKQLFPGVFIIIFSGLIIIWRENFKKNYSVN